MANDEWEYLKRIVNEERTIDNFIQFKNKKHYRINLI
jgi:hypothetical protein